MLADLLSSDFSSRRATPRRERKSDFPGSSEFKKRYSRDEDPMRSSMNSNGFKNKKGIYSVDKKDDDSDDGDTI